MSSSPTPSSSSEAALALASTFDAVGDLRRPVTVVLGTATISVRQHLAAALPGESRTGSAA